MNRLIKYNSILLLSLSSIVLIISGCGSDDKYTPDMFKQEAKGKSGKINIILDKDYWGGALEQALYDQFQQDITYLPEPEPLFSLNIIPRSGFTKGIKESHTLLIFDIDDNPANKNARMDEPQYDVWAKDQVMYKIRASNQKSAAQLFIQKAPKLIEEINKFQRERMLHEFEKNENKSAEEELMLTQKVSFVVPGDAYLADNKSSFAWVKRSGTQSKNGKTLEVQEGILIFSYPYGDSNSFTPDYQINKIDTILKYNVPGPIAGYMAIETDYGIKPQIKEWMDTDRYIFEMRGRYKVIGDLMGGPFLSISFFDEPNSRIVTIMGYVYAPMLEKRELVRELEAMVYSYKL